MTQLQVTDTVDARFENKQVFKSFITPPGRVLADPMYPYRRQIEESTVTKFLATEFNAANVGTGLFEIRVATARVVEVTDARGEPRHFNMERLLKARCD